MELYRELVNKLMYVIALLTILIIVVFFGVINHDKIWSTQLEDPILDWNPYDIVLNNPEIILPRPAFARVVTNSFLGGDVQVAIETSNKKIPKNIAKPRSEDCDSKLIICQGDTITGKQLSSLSNICAAYGSSIFS